jgi:hypothetical protein
MLGRLMISLTREGCFSSFDASQAIDCHTYYDSQNAMHFMDAEAYEFLLELNKLLGTVEIAWNALGTNPTQDRT